MTRDDGRRAEARAIPILQVAHSLGIEGLRAAGVERVGPCPVCGGRDRFGINPPRQVWTCRHCDRGGDGIDLVQHVRGCDFLAALAFLVGAAELAPDAAETARRRAVAEAGERKRQAAEADQRARAIADARAIWDAAAPGGGTPAEAYLSGRGIRFASWPPTLRFLKNHAAQKRIGGRLVTLHSGPCLVAAIQGPAGRVLAVHQTWFDPDRPGCKAAFTLPDGTPAPAKMVRGSKKGGAIRLTPAADRLIMGEGIETTASPLVAGVLPGAAFWAGVDLGNMAGRQVRIEGQRHSGRPDLSDDRAWLPPQGTRVLIFLQDGDSDPKATRAKLEAGLRRAQAARPGLRGYIVAADPGRDFNDMWKDEIE